MEYKRQTSEVQYKGRTVDNPAKRLAAENKAYKARDAAMMREWSQRSKEYGVALQEWNQNLAALDKEQVEFWKTVTPAATKLLSETVPNIMKVKAEKDDEHAIQSFRNLSLEEQNKVRDQARYLFKASDEVYDRRADLEDEARRLGLIEYANLLGSLNKRGDTRIYRELLGGELDNYEQTLRNAIADDTTEYSMLVDTGRKDENGKPIFEEDRFKASEIENDLNRLEHVITQQEAAFYKRVQVGGINTEIITALADERLQEVGQRIARSEGNRITVANAKAETQQIISSIGTDLNLALGWTEEDGYGFKLTEDGKIPPDVEQNFSSILKKLEKQSILAGEADPVNKARDRFAAGLVEWANKQNSPEKARTFVNELLGANGIEENTIKLSNGATFSDIDRVRFGPNGSWSGSTNSVGGTISEDFVKAQDRLDATGLWVPLDKDQKKQSAEWLKANPLVDKNGTLNTAWQNTWQYKLVEASRDSTVNLEEVKDNAVKALQDKGIYDVSTLAKIRNWNPPKSPTATITFVKSLIKDKSALIVGNEIARKDLEGYDMQPGTIEKLKELGITIVDNTVGAADNGRLDAETVIFEKLKLTPGGFTAGKEAILDDIMAKATEVVQAAPNRTPETENELLMNAVNGLLSSEMVAAQEDRTHPWYLNEDGEAVNQFRHGWVPFSNVPAERLKQKLEAETRRNTFILKDVNLNEGPASKQVKLWDKSTLTGIVKQYNEKGYIDFSVLNTTAIAREDAIDAINNQIQEHELDIPLLVKNETYQAFSSAFDYGDIETIYKLNGNKGSKTPSITAARIINDKVDKMLQSNATGFWNMFPSGVRMPNQQSIEKTLMQSFDGDLNTNRDGRLGIYGIPIQEAERIVGPGFDVKTFLGNKDLQEKTIRTFISEESVRNYDKAKDAFRALGKRRSSGFGSAMMVRNMLHTLTTGDRQEDVYTMDGVTLKERLEELGFETFNDNTRLLQIYTGNYNGGFVPSKDNPKYFNRFGY